MESAKWLNYIIWLLVEFQDEMKKSNTNSCLKRHFLVDLVKTIEYFCFCMYVCMCTVIWFNDLKKPWINWRVCQTRNTWFCLKSNLRFFQKKKNYRSNVIRPIEYLKTRFFLFFSFSTIAPLIAIEYETQQQQQKTTTDIHTRWIHLSYLLIRASRSIPRKEKKKYFE